jgi:nucleoside-diphosphate-sugar epimerase
MDDRQTFLGVWLRLVLEGSPLEVWGGSQLRDFTYVDDAVTALLLAAIDERADGATFNLGGCEVVSLTRLAELLVGANAGGSVTIKEFPPDRKRIDIGDYYADYGLIRSTLGWSPQVSLADGLSRTLSYFRPRLDRYL